MTMATLAILHSSQHRSLYAISSEIEKNYHLIIVTEMLTKLLKETANC